VWLTIPRDARASTRSAARSMSRASPGVSPGLKLFREVTAREASAATASALAPGMPRARRTLQRGSCQTRTVPSYGAATRAEPFAAKASASAVIRASDSVRVGRPEATSSTSTSPVSNAMARVRPSGWKARFPGSSAGSAKAPVSLAAPTFQTVSAS